VLRVGLTGDHLRVITERSLGEAALRKILVPSGVRVVSLQPGEPTLEDVFLSLSKG